MGKEIFVSSHDDDQAEFEKSWVMSYVPKGTVQDSISQIKDYAYQAFDLMDKDGNGFIERSEMETYIKDPSRTDRERSFITFLLTNQEAIADQVHEGAAGPKDGISRLDLDAYFKLILTMLK
jgi:hypothetical protein